MNKSNNTEDKQKEKERRTEIVYRISLSDVHGHNTDAVLGTICLDEIEVQEELTDNKNGVTIPINRIKYRMYVGRKEAPDAVSIRDHGGASGKSLYLWPIPAPPSFMGGYGYAILDINGWIKSDYKERMKRTLTAFERTIPEKVLETLFGSIDIKIGTIAPKLYGCAGLCAEPIIISTPDRVL